MERRQMLKSLSVAGLLGLMGCKAEGSDIKLFDGDGTEKTPFTHRYAHGKFDKRSSTLLYARLQVAPILQRIVPYQSTCRRCEIPWAFLTSHTTYYTQGQGIFPLCEDCWGQLSTPAERLPYYKELLEKWKQDGLKDDDTYDAVIAAVMEGK